MSTSIIWYVKEFLRAEWIKKFFTVKTAPLVTPEHFRDYPALTGNECTHCLRCMMICPTPGAIEVLKKGEDHWEPVVYKGHCLRCGLCVEVCPDNVLASGDILERQEKEKTMFLADFHLSVDDAKCMRCGNCSVACPVNKVTDPMLAHSGKSSSDEVIMRVKDAKLTILHPEKCTGCKTCEEVCPNDSFKVARVLEGYQD